MKHFLFLVFALFSFPAWASCFPVPISHYSAKLYLEINTGCDSTESIAFIKRVEGKKAVSLEKYNDREDWPRFPISEECIWDKQRGDLPPPNWEILSCHANGQTPLAGATYKLKRTGTRFEKYDRCAPTPSLKLTKPLKVEIWHYVCVAGCTKRGVPRKLSVPPDSSYCD